MNDDARVQLESPALSDERRVLRAELVLLLFVLVLGAALRVYALLRHPLYQDEIYTVWESRDLFATTLKPGIDARPLYYLLQHVLLDVLPANEAGWRVLPLLFGVAGIPVTWWLGRLVAGPVAGLTAATFLTISAWHISVSSTARYWSLVYLLATIGFIGLLMAYRYSDGRWTLRTLLAMVAGTLTHPTFVFPFASAAVALSFLRPRSLRGVPSVPRALVLRLWLPFLAFLSVFALILWMTGRESAVRNFSGRGILATMRLLPGIVEWFTPTLFGVACIGAALLLGRSRSADERTWAVMALAGIVGGMTALVVSSAFGSTYVVYATALLPLLFVCVGVGVALLVSAVSPQRESHLVIVAVVCAWALLGAGVAPSTISHLSDGTRFDYRPALNQLSREDGSRLALVWPLAVQRHYAPALNAREFRPNVAMLESTLREEGAFWVMASFLRYGLAEDPSGDAERWLGRNCSTEHSWRQPRIDYRSYSVVIYLCRANIGD